MRSAGVAVVALAFVAFANAATVQSDSEALRMTCVAQELKFLLTVNCPLQSLPSKAWRPASRQILQTCRAFRAGVPAPLPLLP